MLAQRDFLTERLLQTRQIIAIAGAAVAHLPSIQIPGEILVPGALRALGRLPGFGGVAIE